MHPTILKLAICMLFITIAGQLKAQDTFSLNGNVRDDNGPLPGATVFLTGTKHSMATNASGNFAFKTLPPGTYQLVIKMVGYLPFLKQVNISMNTTANAVLKPDAIMLNTVTIKPNDEWFRNYEIFKKQFLGESTNAADCKILNAEILSLHYDKKTDKLTASSPDLLVIENKALGYRIKYLLATFEYDDTNKTLLFQGFPSFENLSGSAKEEEDWSKNRATAYQGSIHHLIRAFYNHSVEKEGFKIFRIINRAPMGKKIDPAQPISFDPLPLRSDSLVSRVNTVFKTLASNDCLYIVNTLGTEPDNYTNAHYSLSTIYKGRRVPKG
jgi:hypothetical protein